ncbi:MAG: hypothetical protein J6N49_01430 [Alphaproteobacteria bacterium]|nr:hypothetical protein [Alphaproteobacteria bacterium]
MLNKNSESGRSLLSMCAADAQQFSSAVYNRGTQARKLQAGAAQSGRSMIEMLGVLAIIGVLSVGGIAGYSKAMMQYKINKSVDQITQIVANIRTLYSGQKGYTGLDCYGNGSCSTGHNGGKILKKAHAVPDEMWNTDGTTMENPFGGDVDIATTGKKGNDEKGFSVRFKGVPEEACMALATYDWGSGSSSGLLAVSVNYGTASGFDSAYSVGCTGSSATGSAVACPNGATVSVPMPVSIAATACQEGDNNEFMLQFY